MTREKILLEVFGFSEKEVNELFEALRRTEKVFHEIIIPFIPLLRKENVSLSALFCNNRLKMQGKPMKRYVGIRKARRLRGKKRCK